MTPRARLAARAWAAVAVLVLVLASLPRLVSALPADDHSELSAATVLGRIDASTAQSFTGYAESAGLLALPDAKQLGDLPSLLGETTRMRAWWGGDQRWRVDVLGAIGEKDTYQQPGQSWRWDSGSNRATLVTGAPAVRVPEPVDLLPSQLGHRLAASASAGRTSRLPARRIAGRDAPGVQIVPTDPATTVGQVEVWADLATGVPLRVDVFPRGASSPALASSFLDFSPEVPSAAVTAFVPPAGARVQAISATDLVATVDRFAPYALPTSLAGLPRGQRVQGVGGGVGTYGRGFSVLTVLPLERQDADSLEDRLSGSATAMSVSGSPAYAVSTPLLSGLFVRTDQLAYFLAGTVRPEVLVSAARQLIADPPPRLHRGR